MSGLALCFVLLAPITAMAPAKGEAEEYSGAGGPMLAPPATPEISLAGRGRLRMAQNAATQPGDVSGAEARKKLREELGRIRQGAGSGNGEAPFDPPIPTRKKTTSPVIVPDEATAPQRIQQPMRKIDPEINRVLGQLLLVRFKGSQPSDGGPKAVHALLQSKLIAGAVFGSENIQSKTQLKELMKFFLQGAEPSRPFLAVHEIGGEPGALPPVKDFEQWPAEKDVSSRGDPEYAYSTYRSMGSNLAALGFNMNFGPALVPLAGAKNPSASFGDDPLRAGVFAKTFILGHREAGVIPVPIVDDGGLSLRALKTLLVSYPSTPIAAVMTDEIEPFAAYEGLVSGVRFCFVTLAPGSEAADAAGNFSRGCDVLVLDGGSENPAAVRERVAQGVLEAIRHGELAMDALNASSRRVSALRSSLASLSKEYSARSP